jgi:hypothetical protein
MEVYRCDKIIGGILEFLGDIFVVCSIDSASFDINRKSGCSSII